jgi:putative cell wall-binding protein
MYGNRVVYVDSPAIFVGDIYIATSANEVGRTEGATRYTTAVEASKAYFHAAENAVLCTGLNFPDALAAGPLARLLGGPLLLTKTDEVSAQVMAELARLEVKTVFVIGGADVVSDSVVTQLETAGYTVERLAGADRYATSVEIAKYMDSQLSGAYTVDMAFFARGDNFPDALAVGPVAAGALSPIILVKPTSIPGTVAGVVNTLDITSGVIAGGTDVVSTDVQDGLEAIMQDNGGGANPIERWSGPDRYATAIEVVKNGVEARWVDLDCVGVATGWNFPDALGGGAALGYYGSPLLLVKGETVPYSVSSWVKDNKHAIGEMDIFGGSDVVPDSVKTTLTSLIN